MSHFDSHLLYNVDIVILTRTCDMEVRTMRGGLYIKNIRDCHNICYSSEKIYSF